MSVVTTKTFLMIDDAAKQALEREHDAMTREIVRLKTELAVMTTLRDDWRRARCDETGRLVSENVQLKADLKALLDAIPPCPQHGNRCIGWACGWIQQAAWQERRAHEGKTEAVAMDVQALADELVKEVSFKIEGERFRDSSKIISIGGSNPMASAAVPMVDEVRGTLQPAPERTAPRFGRGKISGRYNQIGPDGTPLSWTVRSPTQLAALCLDAMGENSYEIDIDLPPGAPGINWLNESPHVALNKLCALYGRQVIFEAAADRIRIGLPGPETKPPTPETPDPESSTWRDRPPLL
jgi:hypothetical protein